MQTSPPPYPALDLSPNLNRQFVYTLTGLLPPPIDDTPQALRARNEAAISKVAALLPVNANEADLAAQCIAARAQAEDLLRLLRQHAGDIGLVMRLNAQYGSMVRTSLSVHARLMRVQALRHQRESIDGAAKADKWARNAANLSMLRALHPGAGSQAALPEGAQAASPEGAQAASPEGARTPSPEGARKPSPEGAQAEGPKAPPVPTRPAPPPASLDQRTEKPVSENGTDSQDATFETWLSEQPWNQVPKESSETDLREFVSEVLARSLSAVRELPANGHESPKGADQDCHIDKVTASA